MGKIFHKGLEDDDKKEGLLKRLQNVEGKNKEQLKAIKEQGGKQSKMIMDQNKTRASFLKSICNEEIKKATLLSRESRELFKRLDKMEANNTDYGNLYYESGDHEEFRLGAYGSLASFI